MRQFCSLLHRGIDMKVYVCITVAIIIDIARASGVSGAIRLCNKLLHDFFHFGELNNGLLSLVFSALLLHTSRIVVL